MGLHYFLSRLRTRALPWENRTKLCTYLVTLLTSTLTQERSQRLGTCGCSFHSHLKTLSLSLSLSHTHTHTNPKWKSTLIFYFDFDFGGSLTLILLLRVLKRKRGVDNWNLVWFECGILFYKCVFFLFSFFVKVVGFGNVFLLVFVNCRRKGKSYNTPRIYR